MRPQEQPVSTDNLDEREINRMLALAGSCARIVVLDECDSTNAVLARDASAARSNGTVVTTEVQSSGRGRRGRSWIAPPGGSLALSMLWNFDSGASALAGLSLAAGVAVVSALKRAGNCPVQLKWPNDLVCNGAKLGGILVETRIGSNAIGPVVAIIGVGINVRLRDDDHLAMAGGAAGDVSPQRATDVASILAPVPSRNELLSHIVSELAIALAQFEIEGFSAFQSRWRALHAFHGQWVRILSADGSAFAARVAGIADDGALIVETANGVRHIHAGEVSLRPDVLADSACMTRDRTACG